MAEDRLGLFDTPPNRDETRVAILIATLMFATLVPILPAHDIRLRETSAFIPMIDGIMLLGELVAATLLYAQAAVFRSRALAILASGFLFAALLIVPHALTFPGAFAPNGLLGAGVNTTAWIYTPRRLAFPIAIILYVRFKQSNAAPKLGSELPVAGIGIGVFAAIVLAAAVTLIATAGKDFLPPFYSNRTDAIFPYKTIYHSTLCGLNFAAVVLLLRKRSSVLDMWLLVALSGWLAQSLLDIWIHTRFSLGWYCLFVLMLVSDLVVMVALIAETSWLYARLAQSTSARNRERQARLMTMDAVTAAISHEVGQPLSAVTTNAVAGLNWLTGAKPDATMAIKSLYATIDAGQRTFDVIKSIRAMFAKGPGTATKFSMNELVLETISLLDRELAAKRIKLELSLDEGLPPVVADRVQLQRVLLNLVTNAIESLDGTRRRTRRIAIRSAPWGGEDVSLEISDTGVGIEAEEMARIFDPFFTTKSSGTGLGLSLCRVIIEEHRGQVWATRDEKIGATFHIRLPCSDLPEWRNQSQG